MTYCQQLKSIPTVGASGVLSSYYGALLFMIKGNEVVQNGYNQVLQSLYVICRSQARPVGGPQYKGTIFKVPTFSEWLVIVTSPSLVDDIGKASDAELSSHQAMVQVRAKIP
jgi:hypothetical protein